MRPLHDLSGNRREVIELVNHGALEGGVQLKAG